MTCNDAGLSIIKGFEGWSSTPYLCPAGYCTIGYGSTRAADGERITKDSPEISEDEGEVLLRLELGNAERAIRFLVTAPLVENQFSALCSWVYNLGSGNLRASTLRAKLNRLDYDGASSEFPRWCRAGGRTLPGLLRRRKVEQELFNA